MTTQEFVKQEVNKISKESTLHGSKLFSDGLTKGLEIAEGFAEWVSELRNANAVMRIIDKRPASELLTIFLTEKYGK